MSNLTTSALDPRSAFRYAVRERAMSVGLEQVRQEGWRQLRINQIANEVGVSRPTIYAEFGTKEEFVQALLGRELDRVFHEFASLLETNKNQPEAALNIAFKSLIELTELSPIISGLLTDSDQDFTDSNSPIFTTGGLLPFVEQCSGILTSWLHEVSRGTPKQEISQSSETLARLALSYIMTPVAKPSQTAKNLALAATRLVPELSR